MHIADGIVSTPICVAAEIGAVAAACLLSRRLSPEEVPKMGLMAAALFSASLIHVPVAGTTLHLGLFGLAGVLLGARAFPVVFAALLFQALLFGHGGLLTLGLNSLNMGAGALAAALLWQWRGLPEGVRAFLAGLAGVMIPATLMAMEFHASGYGRGPYVILALYLLAGTVEGVLTASIVVFFRRTGSNLLEATR